MACTLPAPLRKVMEKYKVCYSTANVATGRPRPVGHGGLGPTYKMVYGKPTYSTCERGLREEMRSKDSELLGAGVHRAAYAFRGDDCVVKVARNPDQGRRANMDEVMVSRSLPRSVKQHFTPVEDHDRDYWWLTQPRVETVGEGEGEDAGYDIRRELRERGLDCADLHSKNVGLLHGRSVILDYGFGVDGCEVKTTRPRHILPRLPTGQTRLT